jgi:hypothetical protein
MGGASGNLRPFLFVMPGFMPGIHVFFCGQDVDGRASPGITFVAD